ncbi:MAG: MBL fold metallo-hydrolase [Phycisphaeraceae bacterium]|nr:MBL fold metallo-hydrolase [Phycisphaeraceae bacterium]
MGASVRVIVLVENTVRRQGLIGEHGLAYWIEAGGRHVLFDTGQGQALAHNAERLGLDLSAVEAVVLSHGHYDHTGGLGVAIERSPGARIFLHPQATRRRYSGRGEKTREIGLASVSEAELRGRRERLVWTQGPTEVLPGVMATGEVPRETDYEDTGGDFYLDAQGHEADPILDDQAVYFDTSAGVVVILGCAHAGIINTLRYVQRLTGRPIHAVIGGTHLVNAGTERINKTIEALQAMGLKVFAPAHCTGPRAMAALWTAFPEQIADCSVGMGWTFEGVAPTSR